MKDIFKTNPTEMPTPTLDYFKRKRQIFLTNIGG